MKSSKLRSVAYVLTALCALAAPGSAEAALFFEDQSGVLGTQACNGNGCWSNYARITDYNGDGFLDLVIVNCGGFFSNPSPQPLVFYANDGTGTFANATSAINVTGAIRQVAFGDVDNDGDLDFFAPAAGGAQLDGLYIHEPGDFQNQASTRLPVGLSSDAGAARFGDFDNDGDLDLLVAEGYINDNAEPAKLYTNDGTGVFTLAVGAVPTNKTGVNPDDIDLADIDGDFDLDILINMHSGKNLLWRNNGDGTFVDVSSGLPNQPSGLHYGPVFCDIDGDGDRDLMIDNTANGYNEQILINGGNGAFTDETSTRIVGNTGSDDNIVACIDADGDNDFDLVIGSLSGNERLFINDGTGHFAPESGAFSSVSDPTLWLEFGDLNGDGRLDVLTAQGEGFPELERVYFGTTATPVDVTPPTISAVESITLSPNQEVAVRFAVRDNAVTDEGPRLRQAYVLVGGQKIDARFMGGDLFRAALPASAETTFTVCAEDHAGNLTAGCEPGPSTSSSSASTTAGAGTGSTGSGTTGSGAGGGSADGDGDGDGGDGCSCSAVGVSSASWTGTNGTGTIGTGAGGLVLLTLGLFGAGLRGRRRLRRSAS